MLSVVSLCLMPAAVAAQTAAPPASAPSTSSQPATASLPEAPSFPTTPSQPAGSFQRGGGPQPGTAFEPAGTQASTVREGAEPALQFRALLGFEHESNALRTPSSAAKTSDRAVIAGVGLRADRRYGLQRFRADVEANTYKYDKLSELDYSVVNYALAWDWSITPRFHGVVSADRRQYREINTDPVALVNRVGRRTERTELVEGIYDVGAAWRVLGGLSRTEAKSSELNTWDASPSVQSARVGVGYEFASGTAMYVRFRRGDGKYNDPTPGASTGDFRENETEFHLVWPVTTKTSLEGRIAYLDRSHDTGSARDFDGIVGSAAVSWAVTGKTRVVGGYNRDLSASGLATGGHIQSDRIYIGPVWRATSKIAVNARYDRVSRDWKDVPAGSVELGRNETVQALTAGVDWEPRRWLAVSGYVRGERTKSSLYSGYRNTTIGAAVKAYF
jgi:exopolysaccharide biosynthesis operon protein EpsL